MDSIDRLIIGLLTDNGRIPVSTLAEEIGLSASATSERLRKLEQSGAITGYTVVLDPVALGRPIDALIEVRLDPSTPFDSLDGEFRAMPEVVDAMHLTGSFDYLLRVRCASIDELEQMIRRLKDGHGVRETSTRIALRTIAGFPRPVTPVDSPWKDRTRAL